MLHVVHHPDYSVPPETDDTPPHARDKHALVLAALRASDGPLQLHRPEPMPLPWIEAVHDADYVADVVACRLPRAIERRIGFPVTPPRARRSLLSPGGTWLAARLAIEHGYAANAAGGSHHALHDTGAGYCVFNDLAIAANRLIAEGDAQRILIVDCDVHQGDGTAALLAGRPEIFTLSLHAEKNFPARKARSTLDVGLPDGTGDADYLAVLSQAMLATVEDFRPDLILYQAGVDPHVDDRLGRLALSDAGLAARDRFVIEAARDIPVASAMGGGYGHDLAAVAARHAATMRTLGQANTARRWAARTFSSLSGRARAPRA